MTSTLTRRPQATAFSIEDLLDRVRRGEVRIPDFQRPLKWTAKDVRDLFDSVYRGYPIGTLLFWRKEAPAASVYFGPVRIDAPSHSQALWVVDGQQRITALTGVLLHPSPGERTAQDDFTLYFDLETEEFVSASDGTAPPAHGLPLSAVLDSELLLEWLDRYPSRAEHPEHTRRAIRLGKSIREYQVPAYVVEAAEEKTLRIIFKRLNTAGNPLTQAEVFNALYGGTGGSRPPTSLSALSASLATLGFGVLEESILLRSVLAVRGLDFRKDFQEQLREEDELTETLQQTERALRDTLIFLKRDAGVLHISLLPEEPLLHLLARFFHLHPEPTSRSRELLSRWVWRHAFANATWHFQSEATASLSNKAPEEQTLQALLAELPRVPGDAWHYTPGLLPNLYEPHGRIQAHALASLGPRDLLTGAPLDVAAILAEAGIAELPPILVPTGKEEFRLFRSNPEFFISVANHLFHPDLLSPGIHDLLSSEQPPPLEVLQSHALSLEQLQLLREKNFWGFLMARQTSLENLTERFLKARMRYDASDRPSLRSLIIEDEED